MIRRSPSAAGDSANLPRRLFLLLFVLAVLVRLPIWFGYGAVVKGDALVYLAPAQLMRDGQFHTYEGQRTPVYPLFLVMTGLEPRVTAVAQGLLGIATTLLLFVLAWRHTGRAGLAFAVGAAHTLSIDALFYEPFLITETLTTFLLVAACVLLGLLVGDPRPRRLAALGLGALIGALALTRPMFAFMAPLAALVLLLPLPGAPPQRAARLARAAGAALVALLAIGGWSTYNWRTTGTFAPSTMGGFHLSQLAGAIMEKAPDADSVMRDVYLEHRARIRRETGSHTNTIWVALSDLERATGLSQPELSRRMARISIRLLAAHPADYARTAFPGWIGFWKRVNYWEPERFGALRAPLEGLWRVERGVGIALNAVFLLVSGVLWAGLVLDRRRRADPRLLLLSGIVLVGSVLQAMVEIGNGRYAAPFLPIVQYVVIVGIAGMLAMGRRPAEAITDR